MMMIVVVRLVEILKKILSGSLCLTGIILPIKLNFSYALAQSGQYWAESTDNKPEYTYHILG